VTKLLGSLTVGYKRCNPAGLLVKAPLPVGMLARDSTVIAPLACHQLLSGYKEQVSGSGLRALWQGFHTRVICKPSSAQCQTQALSGKHKT
jgi:hypothetical protein